MIKTWTVIILEEGEVSPHTYEFDGFFIEEHAWSTAQHWVDSFPADIVMVEEILVTTCRHCHLPIKEKVGWILHRWIHDWSSSYVCAIPALTQAEPV